MNRDRNAVPPSAGLQRPGNLVIQTLSHLRVGRFMESPQFILKRIATMNRSLRKSLIFKGGILRFMESLDPKKSEAHWDHEPSEKPQRNEGTQSWLLCAPSFLCG